MSNQGEVCRKGQLEKNIILKIKQIEAEERRRRGTDALIKYNAVEPIHKKQLAFHQCQKRNRWVFGGNRSGKTECGAVECVYMARGIHPYRTNKPNVFGWVVSVTRAVQRDVAQKKILKYLSKGWIENITMQEGAKGSPEYGVIDQIMVRNVFGGISIIGFKSCEEGREKFQGSSLDFVWFDEEPPKDIYHECKMRLIDKKGDMFGTMTPLKGLTFVYDEIYLNKRKDSEVWYEFMEWADNPHLDKDEIEAITSGLSNEELLARRYGKFTSSSGLVYAEFDENVHVIEPFNLPKEWYDCLSIDPGLNNPLSCHWYAVDYDGNVYVIAEHFQAGKDVDYHAQRIKEISERLGWHKDSSGRIRAYIDSAAGQKTLAGMKSVSELFYEKGINVNANVNKDLFSGIQRVKGYLKGENGKPKLYIFKGCDNLIRELKSYWWGDNDRPKKTDDHCLDELRYYLMTKPAAKKLAPSELKIDKERRIKKIINSKYRAI